jgi:hypothetical protein
MLPFTWWVNRKDEDGRNVFHGGFLRLDNIRRIALELAKENPVYQDTAAKFFEHFLRIARAITNTGAGSRAVEYNR